MFYKNRANIYLSSISSLAHRHCHGSSIFFVSVLVFSPIRSLSFRLKFACPLTATTDCCIGFNDILRDMNYKHSTHPHTHTRHISMVHGHWSFCELMFILFSLFFCFFSFSSVSSSSSLLFHFTVI